MARRPNQYRYIVPKRWSKAGYFRSISADGVCKSQLTMKLGDLGTVSFSRMLQPILHFSSANHPSNCNDASMLTACLNTSLNISLLALLPTQGDLD